MRDEARAVVKDNRDPATGQAAAAEEAHRIREQAVEAIQALEVMLGPIVSLSIHRSCRGMCDSAIDLLQGL